MPIQNILQEDYTAFSSCYQIKLPLDVEIMIPSDDPVRLLSAFVEGMPAPDHATLARFISLHLSECSKETMAAMTALLYELGEISGKTVFIDGTKIESCANKYTFVWKKAVTKSMEKLFLKITEFVEECETAYGLKVVYKGRISLRTLKRLRKKLCRIKEDAMLNGQLKPAYNVQHGVDAEYITWVDISSHPTDTLTLIPFLKDMEEHLPFKYAEITADAGYESEENYVFIEGNGQTAYIKPQNYEISKKRTYKTDISRRENMEYHEETDCYICKNGKSLTARYDKRSKSKSGYISTVTVYECEECGGCPYKKECIRGNNCKIPLEERTKRINVSKVMKQKRQECLERITNEYGSQLRMNRSIQAEGSFADVKEDMNFRRYLYRGKKNVLAQSILLAIGRNFHKLHHKIQSGRTGNHLFEMKKTAQI